MSRTRTRGLISNINVVPYVDVMLVLLVIFMITAPLLSEGIVIDLPDVEADPLGRMPDEPLVLSVDQGGRFYLSFGGDVDTALDEGTVVDRARAIVQRRPDVPIFVRGDEGAVHGRVMRGFALLKEAGAEQVILVTEFPDSEP